MAKITDLTELAVAPDTNDLFIIEDVSATTTKKIQTSNLRLLTNPRVFTGTYSNPGASGETVVATISIPSQVATSTVVIMASSTWTAGSGAPTYSIFKRLRLTNISGAVQTTARGDKTGANGVAENVQLALTFAYSLPASTAQTFVITIDGSSLVNPTVTDAFQWQALVF